MRIVVELIVPDYEKEAAVVDLIERRPERIVRFIADASIAVLQALSARTRIGELLAPLLVVLCVAAERTDARCPAPT